MQVPLLDLHAQYQPQREAIIAALTRVADSQRFILGPEVEQLERELEATLAVAHTIGVSSGTDALLASMMAIGIGPGDEVITSPYSFFATAGCVTRLGATPVFVDIDPATFNIDPELVEAALTPRTKAIMPVHLFGQSADMDPLLGIAAKASVAVIEDACQSIGARYKTRQVGGLGTVGCFSFFPSKNLGACGDAGLITTQDATLAAGIRRIRVHGADRQYHHQVIGGNFRLDAIHAAVLRVKLPKLEQWSDARRANAARYAELVHARGLDDVVRLPPTVDGRDHIYNQYVIRVPKRDEVRAELERRGVGTAVYYPVPFHLQECFAYLGYRAGQFPEAERAASETLALPIYGELTEAQQVYVVDQLAAILADHR